VNLNAHLGGNSSYLKKGEDTKKKKNTQKEVESRGTRHRELAGAAAGDLDRFKARRGLGKPSRGELTSAADLRHTE